MQKTFAPARLRVNAGETGVLKDAAGLGLLLLLIASVQLLSFVAGA